MRIAAVMTCHNRRAQTLACLEGLSRQRGHGADITPYVVDDGSSDGTAEAVRQKYPEVQLLRGDGNLFWAPGMRLALATAFQGDYDFYLWLNDDTTLDDNAVAVLLSTYRELSDRHGPTLVAGCTRDPQTGQLTYGGRYRPSKLRRHHFEVLPESPDPQPTETINGNVVLVSAEVAQRLGNMTNFRHSFADQDYGLRARAAGVEVWLAPKTIATCVRNPVVVYGSKPLVEELRGIFDIRGLLPADWAKFSRRWHGPFWPAYFISPYLSRITKVGLSHLRRAIGRQSRSTA